ncbi:hypothetical protein BGY98DRAFT_1096205 [Russula aff. rugulosa BPL654]|nr:hypothetical protein BGY98DRAFT_1096205 [Russula aff. rugulosa BPL654]
MSDGDYIPSLHSAFSRMAAVITPSQVQLITLKLWHAIGALYIWEFLTTVDYEWKVIRGRLPYRWTIWIYSLARVAALLGVIFYTVIMDITTEIDSLDVSAVFFLCLSATMSSLLIVLRTIAIWNQNKVVLVLAISIWVTNIAFHLQNVITYRSVWVPAHLDCESVKTGPGLLAFYTTIISEMVLFLIVFAGLLVMRCRRGVTFGLTRLIWSQGVIWLILGCAADIPPLVLTSLHLNDPLHAMFEAPGVIIMTIAATRMHRSLVNFASSDVIRESPQASGLAFAKSKQTDTASTIPHQVEIAVHKVGSTSGGDSTTTFSTKSAWPPPAASSSHSIPQIESV